MRSAVLIVRLKHNVCTPESGSVGGMIETLKAIVRQVWPGGEFGWLSLGTARGRENMTENITENITYNGRSKNAHKPSWRPDRGFRLAQAPEPVI